MPWYYVLVKPGNFPNCIESESTPDPEFFTVMAGPFAQEKDCIACQTTGACGGESASGSALVPPIPSSRYLCKSLEQLKYGREVYGLQCNKTRVVAKEVGYKFARDYYVAGGCTDIVHAKFMEQRRFGRDVYVFGEGCCAGSESASASASQSISASSSQSASVSSSSSVSISESQSFSGSSTSGSITSGSQTGIITNCCPLPLPRILYATVVSASCPQYNGTYELVYAELLTQEDCNISQTWRNRPPPAPTENCIDPPYIALICCDGSLALRFELSSISICLPPLGEQCEIVLENQCEPLLVQLQVQYKTWYDDDLPPNACCTIDPDFLITVTT